MKYTEAREYAKSIFTTNNLLNLLTKFDIPSGTILHHSKMIKGNKIHYCECTKCGKQWEINDSDVPQKEDMWGSLRKILICSNCSTKRFFNYPTTDYNKRCVAEIDNENFLFFTNYQASGADFKEFIVYEAVLYIKDFGLLTISSNTSMSKITIKQSTVEDIQEYIKQIKTTPVKDGANEHNIDFYVNCLQKCLKERKIKEEKAKLKNKPNVKSESAGLRTTENENTKDEVELKYENWTPPQFFYDYINTNGFTAQRTGSIGVAKTYQMKCKKCGQIFSYTFDNGLQDTQDIECPCCHQINNWVSYQEDNFAFFVNSEIDPDDLILVHFDIVNDQIIVLGFVVYNKDRVGYHAIHTRAITPYNERFYQTKDEICDVINNSSFKFSGYKEALEMPWHSVQRSSSTFQEWTHKYLVAYTAHPVLELIVKANLKQIAAAIIEPYYRDNELLNNTLKNGSNITTVLDTSKSVLKLAQKLDLSLEEFSVINEINKLDPNCDIESILLKDRSQSINLNYLKAIVKISKQFNIEIKRILEYIQSAYDHQCIEKPDCVSIWYDYLNMCEQMHIDLSDKYKKFPSSLKKEHDITMFAHRSVKQKIDQELFSKNAKRNKELLSYKGRDFSVIIPSTPQDVIKEATDQHNCLRSYITSLTNGSTMICFIRKIDDIDNGYVTVEVSNSMSLVQIKGKFNSNPLTNNPQLKQFVEEWCRNKHITKGF